MPPWLQLSLGSGYRPRGVNGFPLLAAAECLNMLKTVRLSHKTSYERKARSKEERERDTSRQGNRYRARQRKKRNIFEMIK